MLFLQILAVVFSGLVGTWLVGVFLIAAFSHKVRAVGFGNMLIGIPLLTLAAWLPFAFGWIGV